MVVGGAVSYVDAGRWIDSRVQPSKAELGKDLVKGPLFYQAAVGRVIRHREPFKNLSSGDITSGGVHKYLSQIDLQLQPARSLQLRVFHSKPNGLEFSILTTCGHH